MKSILLQFTMAVAMTLTVGSAFAQKPSKDDITKAMRTIWDKPATSLHAKSSIEINDIKIGTWDKSTYAQQLEGVPKGATVTLAKIDFTESTFNTDQTQKVRRITTGWVYKDQFGEWVVMNVGTTYPDK